MVPPRIDATSARASGRHVVEDGRSIAPVKVRDAFGGGESESAFGPEPCSRVGAAFAPEPPEPCGPEPLSWRTLGPEPDSRLDLDPRSERSVPVTEGGTESRLAFDGGPESPLF